MKFPAWMHQRLFEEAGEADGGGGTAVIPDQRDGELAAMRAQLAERDQQFNGLIQSLQRQAQPQPTQPAQPSMTELNAKHWQNPVQHTAEIAQNIAVQTVQGALGNLMAQDHETMVSMAIREARGDDQQLQGLFDKYRDEIQREVYTLQPQFHRNVNVWATARDKVIGRHFREINYEKKDAERGENRAPAARIKDGPQPPSSRQAPAARVEELSPDQKQMARRLRLSEDQYRQGMKDLENQGDPNDPRQPSAWDRVMTFDENSGRNRKAS